ncbi:MAG: AAA family ATPase, partial [Alphaproteobacteria bacterium]|nr:AAA family ATPase [Alphaproteobacteria bacterium]
MDRNHELSHHNSFIARNSRGGVVASAAYVSRSERTEFDPETGEAFKRWDYSGVSHHAAYAARREAFGAHDDLAFSEVRLPAGAPAWASDGKRLWNGLEAQENAWADRYYRRSPELAEKHKAGARLAMKGHISLAKDLDREAAIAAAREIIDRKFVSRGQAVEWALHWKEGQPHLHYVASARVMTAEGFGKQARWTAANGRDYAIVHLPKAALGEWARETREIAAEVQNRLLSERGTERRVEYRSFADRGLNQLPMAHEGVGHEKAEIAAINSHRCEANSRLAVDDPKSFVADLFSNAAVMDEARIKAEIFRQVQGSETEFEAAWQAIRPALVSLGEDVAGRAMYTSAEYRQAEDDLAKTAGALAQGAGRRATGLDDAIRQYQAERGFELNGEQRNALRHATGQGDLALIVGRAGTGKTTIMEVARRTFEADGRKVRGFATAAVAADNLEREAGIESTTIAGFLFNYRLAAEARATLADPTTSLHDRKSARRTLDRVTSQFAQAGEVLVIDEAGMVGTREMRDFLAHAHEAGAKVVLVGDHAQLSSVSAGQAFRLLRDTHGAAVLADIRRQRDGDRAASIALTEGRVAEALAHYRDQGAIRFSATADQAFDAMAEAYLVNRAKYGAQQVLMTAVRNVDVAEINQRVRARLKARGELADNAMIGDKELAIGEQIVFLKNKKKIGVLNGMRVEITAIRRDRNGTATGFVAQRHDGAQIVIQNASALRWTYSYAITVHKSQGQGVKSAGHFAKAESLSAALVAFTRHTEHLEIFADRETYQDDLAGMSRDMSRERNQELVADYTVSDAREPARARIARYADVCRSYAAAMADAAAQADQTGDSIFKTEKWEHARLFQGERQALALDIAAAWEDHRVFARQAGVRRVDVDAVADPSKKVLSDNEVAARGEMQAFAPLVEQSRDLWNEIKATHAGARSREHPRFAEYEALRCARDAAANSIAADRRLYAQFAREAGITWTSIQKQAEAHTERLAEAVRVEALPAAVRSLVEKVQDYKAAAGEVGAAWAATKAEGIDDSEKEQRQEAALVATIRRDEMAAGLVADLAALDAADPAAAEIARGELGRVKIDLEKLSQQAAGHRGRPVIYLAAIYGEARREVGAAWADTKAEGIDDSEKEQRQAAAMAATNRRDHLAAGLLGGIDALDAVDPAAAEAVRAELDRRKMTRDKLEAQAQAHRDRPVRDLVDAYVRARREAGTLYREMTGGDFSEEGRARVLNDSRYAEYTARREARDAAVSKIENARREAATSKSVNAALRQTKIKEADYAADVVAAESGKRLTPAKALEKMATDARPVTYSTVPPAPAALAQENQAEAELPAGAENSAQDQNVKILARDALAPDAAPDAGENQVMLDQERPAAEDPKVLAAQSRGEDLSNLDREQAERPAERPAEPEA